MPDVLIDSGLDSSFNNQAQFGMVWTSPTVVYAFFNVGVRIQYRKSIDGGLTWAARVQISTLAARRFVIYYDRWTAGDVGNEVHIFFGRQGPDGAAYVSFDTSNDTIGSVVTIDSTVRPNFDANFCLSISKSRGGNLGVVGWHHGGAAALPQDRGFWTSPSPYTTWTKRADPTETNTEREDVILFPGNEADNQDFWLVYHDESAQQVSLKVFDDSANSWSETVITGAGDTDAGGVLSGLMIAGSVRHSDGHLFLTVKTSPTANDLRSWEINGAASIVERGVVISVEAGMQDLGMMIDQNSGRIYAVYANQQANHDVRYHTSDDGAVTWSVAIRFNDTAGGILDATPHSIGQSIGSQGGKFMPMWNDVNGGTRKLRTNADNSVTILALSQYIIEVDWDDDGVFGSFADEDITKDVRSLTFDRGRDTELDDMPAGTLLLSLNDTLGDYSPENSSSRFGSGDVTLNRRIRVRFVKDGTLFPLWRGRITGITPHPAPEDRTATITAADEFEQFGRLDVEGPAAEPLEDVFIGATGGPIPSLLDFLGFPAADRILDTGNSLLNLWWERGKKGLDAITDLMQIEQGLSYIDRAGKFRFEARDHRLAGTTNPHRVSQFTFDRSMVDFDYDFSGRTVKNVARVTIHDREIAAGAPDPGTTVIFATPLRPRIEANSKITIRATYDQPARDVTFPVTTADYRIDSSPGGSGDADLEFNVLSTLLVHGQSMDLILTNNNNIPVFVVPGDSVADPDTALEIRGNLYSDDSLTWEEGDETPATPSVAEFGKRSIDIDSEFVSSPAFANNLALFLKARFEQPQPDFVKMTVYGSTTTLLQAILDLEIHDRVTVIETQLGISRDYFINRLEHTADVEFGTIPQVTYSLARADAEEFWVLGDAILGLLGQTTFLGF